MKDRRLVRPSLHSPHTYADVVGVVPSAVYARLSSSSSSSEVVASGRLVDAGDGAAATLLVSGGDDGVSVWRHAPCTLSEELTAPVDHEVLGTSFPVASTRGDLLALASRREGAPGGGAVTMRDAYACSTEGRVCAWDRVLLSSDGRTTPRRSPDASATLFDASDGDERATAAAPVDGRRRGDRGGMVVGTSAGRALFVSRAPRRSGLEVRELEGADDASSDAGGLGSVLGRFLPSFGGGGVADATAAADATNDGGVLRVLFAATSDDEEEAARVIVTVRRDLRVAAWAMEDSAEDVSRRRERLLGAERLGESVRNAIVQDMKLTEGRGVRLEVLGAAVSKINTRQQRCSLLLTVRASTAADERRLYLLHCVVNTSTRSATDKDDGVAPPLIILRKAHWLSRYTSDAAASASCAGVVVDRERFRDDDDPFVAYTVWQQSSESSVSVTMLRHDHDQNDLLIDAELPRDVVPSVLAVGRTDDAEGASLVSRSGCVISVRVRVPEDETEEKDDDDDDDADAGTTDASDAATSLLVNHLLSSFSSSRAEGRRACSSSVPPSLLHASHARLDAAVVRTDAHLLRDKEDGDARAPRDFLLSRQTVHQDLVNFLRHTSLYRRLTSSARGVLADHGEAIAAGLALLRVVDEDLRTRKRRRRVDDGAPSLSEKVADDCARLLEHLPRVADEEEEDDDDEDDRAARVTVLLHAVFAAALDHRRASADVLYDDPARADPDASSSAVPWTADATARRLLWEHLEHLRRRDDDDGDDADAARVELLGTVLLDGHRASSRRLDGAPSYEEAKRTVAPLLLRRSGEETALRVSVRHHHYDGVLDVLDAKRRRGESVDDLLADLLARSPPLPPDVATGLSFPEYVMTRCSRENRAADLLELGAHRPDELREFLRRRLPAHAWIEDVRAGRWGDARSSAAGLASETQSLRDRRLFLGLSRLADKVASEEERDPLVVARERAAVDRGLVLARCQSLLGASDGAPAASAADLVALATTRIAEATDVDDRVRAALSGLAASETMDDPVPAAAAIWTACVDAEADGVWTDLARRTRVLTEDEVRDALARTTLFSAARRHALSRAATGTRERGDDVGVGLAGNQTLRTAVFDKLADRATGRDLEELKRLVRVAGQLAVADLDTDGLVLRERETLRDVAMVDA